MTSATDGVGEALSRSCGVKVHRLMCKELKKCVDKIKQILPALESAQPRCRSGIDALCSLNLALEKANLLMQHCTESSKLYLVVTGVAIKLRCERVQNAFGQSLSQIQSMVPLLLAAQISAVVDDLKDVNFIMESSEEEAGKLMLDLLRQASNSTEDSELQAFQVTALRLQLTSPKAILIEKRSIKKLLDKVCNTDQTKERILKYLLYLLRKHGQSIRGLQPVNSTVRSEDPDMYAVSSDKASSNQSIEPQGIGDAVYEIQTDASCKPMPPDEYRCPISLRLMHDPVVIASGQTFERVWIEDWFKEGNNTCPKTQQKLSHLTIVPNTSMKDLISKWCRMHGISVPNPSSLPIPAEVYQWRTSSSSSIASFGSSLCNVPVRLDVSCVSFSSADISSLAPEMFTESSVSHETDNYFQRSQSSLKFSHGMDSSSLSKLSGLSWEFQYEVIEDVRKHLDDNEAACNSILCTGFFQTLVRFFKDACDRSDIKAQRVGARVLQIFVTKNRNEVPSFYEDIFYLLVSFLDSEITEEALAIIEVLSGDQYCTLEVVASGSLPSILKILESEKSELQIPALGILCNLSSQSNIGAQIVHLGYIPKLISLLGNRSLAQHCMSILKNLCHTEEGRLAIGETKELIVSIVELLETGSREEQEHAVSILHSLCAHRIKYCKMVLDEDVIPPLVTISVNGNAKGKEVARELLRLLKDIGWSDSQNSVSLTESFPELPYESGKCSIEKQSVSKAPGYFRRKLKFFSKPRSVALY